MYTERFGLTAPPFQLTPDARFWFESRTHKKAMAYLGYGLAQAEGFIVITGEIGAGKSTLVAHLLATIDRNRLNAISLVSTQVAGDDMLRLVAQRLGVATGAVEKARLLDLVETRLDEEARAGKRNLLIVDEAQALAVSALEELRMLSNFQRGGRPLVQIVLLGQPEFRDHLGHAGLEQLRQRVIATHHLDAMGADEIAAYVGHRLKVVGWSGTPAFDANAFAAIHRHTGGIPRRVNQLANRLLLSAAIEDSATIDARMVDAVAADMAADSIVSRAAPEPAAAPVNENDRVLPLRSSPVMRPVAVPDPVEAPERLQPAASEAELLARIGALESRIADQEASLKRILVLLVEWIETGEGAGACSNAA